MRPNSPTQSVLIAEDDEVDRLALKKAFEDNGDQVKMVFVTNGAELMDYLERSGPAAFPQLILLDLNLPGMDGRLALKWLKGDGRYRRIPTVVLTQSSHPEDVNTSLAAGADAFFNKPKNFNGLVHLVRLLKDSWLPQSQPQPTR